MTKNKGTTLDDLVRMVQEGFAETVSKKEFTDFRVEMQEEFRVVRERIDKLEKQVGIK